MAELCGSTPDYVCCKELGFKLTELKELSRANLGVF